MCWHVESYQNEMSSFKVIAILKNTKTFQAQKSRTNLNEI